MAAPTEDGDARDRGLENFPFDAVLSLVRWQQTRRGYDGDAALIETGLGLLSPDESGNYGAHSLLSRAEAAFNVSWQRMAAEVMQFAVFLVTKAKRDDEARPEQTKQGLRLLQLSLAAFASKQRGRSDSPFSLSTNSCNLLLSALAEALETTRSSSSDGLRTLQDVKYIFVHLFGLPHDASNASLTPSFQLYRPPTNVFADFMDRALSASFKQVDALTAAIGASAGSDATQLTEQVKEHVALVSAVVCVYQELQKTQMNKRKVFLAVAKTSLRAILRFRHAIDKWTTNDHVHGAVPILKRLDQTIEDALFDAEHIREFDSALVHQRSVWAHDASDSDKLADGTEESKRAGGKAKKRRNNDRSSAKQSALISYQKQLFDELLSILVDNEVSLELRASGVGEFMRVLMRGFSTRIRAAATSKIVDAKSDPKTSRKRAAIVIAATSTTYSPFKFWAELCAVAFLAFQQQFDGSKQDGDHGDAASILVVLYHSLFKSLCEYDVYRVTEDTEEREQFTTMEKVLSSFFARLPSDISDVLEADSAIDAKHIADMRCRIVSSAVECSPNLVDCCCTAILEMLGAQTQSRANGSATVRIGAESQTVVDLVQAYDSMRLLEKLLRAAFAVCSENASEARGLYALLSQPTCEARLRKAFVALPPGQVDVLWNLLVDEVAGFSGVSPAASEGGATQAMKLGIVRLVFQMFMQEIHVTPQNRTKVVTLVTKALEALVDPVADAVAGAGNEIVLSAYDREVCSIFGELLMFYNAAKSASTTANTLISHFEAVFDKIGGSCDRFMPVIETLLLSSQPQQQQSKKKTKSGKESETTTRDDGLSRAGIIKICVHWLQKARTTGDGANATRTTQGERITKLVIDYVVQTHCWDAVAFYLPELTAHATMSGAQALLHTLIDDYVAHAAGSSSNSAPQRILFDAAFYEIVGIRQVAAAALASCAEQHAASIRAVKPKAAGDTVLNVAGTLEAFFSFLVSVPEGYMRLLDCGDLLAQVFAIYKTLEHITTDEKRRQVLNGARTQVLAWLRVYFRPIAVAAFRASSGEIPEEIQKGVRFVFEHDAIETVDPRVIAEMLHFVLKHEPSSTDGEGDDSFVSQLLRSNIASTEEKKRARRAITVIQAIARAHRDEPSLPKSKAETEAVNQALELLLAIRDEQGALHSDDPLVLDLLRTLVTHHAAVSDTAGRKRKHSGADDDEHAATERNALFAHIGPALASSMKLISTAPLSDASSVSHSAAWAFFDTCCAEYSLVRSAMVDELKGFGFLLAAALSALGTWTIKHQTRLDKVGNRDFDEAATPLRNLVRAANKQEFRLLLATIRKEVAAPEMPRKLAALVVLCDVVTGGGDDKKLSATRRQCISEFKEALLAALVQNVGELLFVLQASAPDQQTKTEVAAEVAVWNVRALMLLFCKPELFTWKAPELTQAFVGFDMLYTAASPLSPTHCQLFSLDQLHRIWTYSYALLLRIVRHHFASVVNCIPHLIQASNALLQVLVSVSNQPFNAKLEASAQWPLLVEWSSNLARLFGYMKEHDAQLRKHVVYLMMPFLVAATRGKLPVVLQQKLRPGVFALLDMCSPYEKEQLYAALDSSGKSLLKMLDTSYKLTHRYAGKV